MRTAAIALLLALLGIVPAATSFQHRDGELLQTLRNLDSRVFTPQDAESRGFSQLLRRDIQQRLEAACLRESQAWRALRSRTEWESFRDTRLAALQKSLGEFPTVPKSSSVQTTRTVAGDGFRIENLVIESRTGLLVTANLYSPLQPKTAADRTAPGIIISHSHHNAKTQGELQDMGMTWARHGCYVLVPDHLGHGERRQHPFRSEKDYAGPFRVGRQDYYFRHVAGLQLHLIGESLMGWMVWDLMRCVDVLLAQPRIDPSKIILLGAVAGGGDPAGVTAALDPRIAAVAPFNFGGVQPDYATPANTDRDFYWFGVPYWESTRCLRLGARDGFAHWVIVGSVAPRRLIHAHEFAWDATRDPAWPRLQQIYRWYDATDRLASAAGQGTLKGSPPESSHCNNIGPLHRSRLYPTLQRWFELEVPTEYSRRLPSEDLMCLPQPPPDAVRRPLEARPLHVLAGAIGSQRAESLRRELADKAPAEQRVLLRERWATLLGGVKPSAPARVQTYRRQVLNDITLEFIGLECAAGQVLPTIVISGANPGNERRPAVIGLTQSGKEGFLKHRAAEVLDLARAGLVVCLVDLRGTGETRFGSDSRGRSSSSASLSSTAWLVGETLLGARLRDVRSLLEYLRTRPDVDRQRIALWGESFVPPHPESKNLAVPLDGEPFPHHAEPLGGLLALLTGLYEEEVAAVLARGSLATYQSVLESPFCYVPHDAMIPAVLTAGDLPDVAAALAPRPLRLEGLVNGLNRVVSREEIEQAYHRTEILYRSLGARGSLALPTEDRDGSESIRWLKEKLKGGKS